jgi:hypothetical protein
MTGVITNTNVAEPAPEIPAIEYAEDKRFMEAVEEATANAPEVEETAAAGSGYSPDAPTEEAFDEAVDETIDETIDEAVAEAAAEEEFQEDAVAEPEPEPEVEEPAAEAEEEDYEEPTPEPAGD